jgi:uncharacterized protein
MERAGMREELIKLFGLQAIDSEIDRRKIALAALDNGDVTRREVEELKQSLAEVESELRNVEKEYLDSDLALKTIEEKKQKAEKLLYSGKVNNLKELQDLQNEIAMFGREIDKFSTSVLELMDILEPLKAKDKSLKNEIQQAEAKLAEIVAAYEKDSGELKAEIAGYKAQREEYVPTIEARLLKRYEGLRQRSGPLAVAAVKRETCEGCHVTLPRELLQSVQASKSPQSCEFCGRMLVWMGKEETEEAEEE